VIERLCIATRSTWMTEHNDLCRVIDIMRRTLRFVLLSLVSMACTCHSNTPAPEVAADRSDLAPSSSNEGGPGEGTQLEDPVEFELRERALTAITMQFGGDVPTDITGHPGSRTTSYVGNGDQVASQAIAGAETRDRWYFIDDLEVMAPATAYAIAVLGDSITDGFGILNDYARWPDFMTLELEQDPVLAESRSVLNFGKGANFLLRPIEGQDPGVLRFERDVLGRDKVKWLIVMEGVNDLNANVAAAPLIEAYRSIIQRAHENGILVYGSPITPCSGCGARLGSTSGYEPAVSLTPSSTWPPPCRMAKPGIRSSRTTPRTRTERATRPWARRSTCHCSTS
jgi:lysophospholipase L1-like esterase